MRGFDDLVASLTRDCPDVLMQVDLPAEPLRPIVPPVGCDGSAIVKDVRALRLVDLADEEATVIAKVCDARNAFAAANDSLTDTRTQAQQLVEDFADAASEPVQTAVEELSAQVAVAVAAQETGAETIDDATQSLAGLEDSMEALVEAVTSQADPAV